MRAGESRTHHGRLAEVDRVESHQVALHESFQHGEGHVAADGSETNPRETQRVVVVEDHATDDGEKRGHRLRRHLAKAQGAGPRWRRPKVA